MIDWRFEVKQKRQKSRDPMQASFFTNVSINDDTHALVREAIQNSLDARDGNNADDAVHVRFVIGTITANTIDRYISSDARAHFNADDNGLENPPKQGQDCRYLAYEDFNTTGLLGNEKACDAEPGNSFYYFLRAEGQSGKDEGDRGRHGIGKYVFPYTSGIRTFLTATVRSSDKRCLIAGQSVLKSHSVDDTRYTPDGWWGTFEDEPDGDYLQLPAEDSGLLKQMSNDFKLDRTMDRSGLSIVIPYIDQELTPEKLAEHIIAEFFFPILGGQLTVEIVSDGKHSEINSAVLRDGARELLSPKRFAELGPFLKLAIRAVDEDSVKSIELALPDRPRLPKWDDSYIDKQTAKDIQYILNEDDGCLKIQANIHVRENGGAPVQSCIDLYLSGDAGDGRRKPLFIREGITIPEDRVPKVRGYICMAVIRKGPLATLLGDAENPAHTEWEKNAPKFKGKYQWGPTTIDFVRLSFQKIIKLLGQAEEEEDRNILADIFYTDFPENEEEVPESRRNKNRSRPGGDGDPGPPAIPPLQVKRYYRLNRLEGGFHLRGSDQPMTVSRRYTVRVAYDIEGSSTAAALRKHHINDFNLGKMSDDCRVQHHGVTDATFSEQGIRFTAADNRFDIRVIGFDQRRDIVVDVRSEEISNETV